MGSLRVRWRAVARGTAVLGAVLLGVQLLPSLLEPGPPPPLAADIGLPRGTPPSTTAEPRRRIGVSRARALRPAPRPHSHTRPEGRAPGRRPHPAPPPRPAPP